MEFSRKLLISMCLFMIVGMGCTNRDTGSETEPKIEGKPFLIGLIPEHNLFKQVNRYEPLADYLSKKTGLDIKLKVLARYGNIIDNFVSADLDAAFFGSFTYALAHAKLEVEPIARPESVDGISTYHGLILVREDSGIKSAEDMKGKSFAFVDSATTAGYLLPLVYFKENGIKDYKKFLKETYFTGTHEDAIYDVFNKKADVGAAKNTVFARLVSEDHRLRNELVCLKRSPDVPENALAVRKGLEDSIRQKLKETLLNMHHDPDGIIILQNFGARRFIETNDDDYINVYKYTQQIGLSLSTYHYVNE